MKIKVIAPWVFLFLLAGHNIDARAERDSSILSATLAKSQMMQIIRPRLEWAMANNNYAVQLFDADWKVVPNESIALYQQARQVYIFAKGFEVTKDHRYLNAMIKSADFMIEHMYDESTSNWFANLNKYNFSQHTQSKEYDTAFALFAMAHAYDVSREKRYLDKALATWMLSDLATGFLLAKSKESSSAERTLYSQTWSTNALMHLFEALLALHDTTQSGVVWRDIEIIANFVATSLMQERRYIAEYYKNVDQPLPIVDGGYVELGHQIEWAYLLHTAVARGLDIKYRDVANKLVKSALAIGWDDSVGSLAARASYSEQVIENKPVWWAQAELMRLLTYLNTNTHNIYLFSKSYAFCVNNYIDQINGGWQAKIPSTKESKKQAKVLGYHAVAAYFEVINKTKEY